MRTTGGDQGSSGGPGHQPAVTMGYHDAKQRFPWEGTRSSLLSMNLIVVGCRINEGDGKCFFLCVWGGL